MLRQLQLFRRQLLHWRARSWFTFLFSLLVTQKSQNLPRLCRKLPLQLRQMELLLQRLDQGMHCTLQSRLNLQTLQAALWMVVVASAVAAS